MSLANGTQGKEENIMADNATNTATTQGVESTVTAQTATEGMNTQTNGAAANDAKAVDIEALIQRAVDRATNKLGNENKKLRGEIDTLKKANMDADEVKKLELSEKEQELAERDKKLTDRENRLFAIKAIKEIGLDDGSDASLALVDFVMAENEEGITERVKAFDALVKRMVQTRVDGVFKANGRTPGVGNTAATTNDEQKNNVAVQLGKNAAKVNEAARSTLDYYLGGRK